MYSSLPQRYARVPAACIFFQIKISDQLLASGSGSIDPIYKQILHGGTIPKYSTIFQQAKVFFTYLYINHPLIEIHYEKFIDPHCLNEAHISKFHGPLYHNR